MSNDLSALGAAGMEQEMAEGLNATYGHLLTLWTTGVRDYHTMLSDYLTANSIFVAVVGLLISRESLALTFTVLILMLGVIGILLSLQMAIVLGRLSGQNALWEWQLRGIERMPGWTQPNLVNQLFRLRERQEPIEQQHNEPPVFQPNWAFRQHPQWWAHRAVSFPWFFGSIYGMFVVWSATQLWHVIMRSP
ncbi:hypothetical protein [Nitrospira sp. Nam80]